MSPFVLAMSSSMAVGAVLVVTGIMAKDRDDLKPSLAYMIGVALIVYPFGRIIAALT
jgi:hypothetical protein